MVYTMRFGRETCLRLLGYREVFRMADRTPRGGKRIPKVQQEASLLPSLWKHRRWFGPSKERRQ